MTPTNNLRILKKKVYLTNCLVGIGGRFVLRESLQQWWASDPTNELDFSLKRNGVWRDIPLEEEEEQL